MGIAVNGCDSPGGLLSSLARPNSPSPRWSASYPPGHNVLEVVTQPDRPKGRKQELDALAGESRRVAPRTAVYQPEKIRHAGAVAHLSALAPEAMVIVGYGQIIPQSIIDIAPLGIINVHASLLPELRGAAPIQWSIARGYERTGVTTMRIDAGLDTGDIAAAVGNARSVPMRPRPNFRRDWPPQVRIY